MQARFEQWHRQTYGEACDEAQWQALQQAFATYKPHRRKPAWAEKPKAPTIKRGPKGSRYLSSSKHKLPVQSHGVTVPVHIRRALLMSMDPDALLHAAQFVVQEGKLSEQSVRSMQEYGVDRDMQLAVQRQGAFPRGGDDIKFWIDSLPEQDLLHLYFCYDNTRTTMPQQHTPYPPDDVVRAASHPNDATVATGAQVHMNTQIPVKGGPKLRWNWQHNVPHTESNLVPIPSKVMDHPYTRRNVSELILLPAATFATHTSNGNFSHAEHSALTTLKTTAPLIRPLLKPQGPIARGSHECHTALGITDETT